MTNSLRIPGILWLGLLALTAFLPDSLAAGPAEAGPVYELRIYTVHPGKMPDLLARFRDHTRAIFDRHGMVSVGYWLPVDPHEGDKLYYILRHPDRAAARAAWQAFGADPEWQAVARASEAHGPIVSHVDSIFLALTDYSPAAIPADRGPRVFELRTYTTNPGKLGALDARFRDHTMALFVRHGMTSLFYWHPTDPENGAGRTLVYLLAHPSREEATRSWDAFRADPEWTKVRTESERDGSLLVPDGVKSVFLRPTDFSAIK